jgi:uncharacterized membrane protein YphA (DoxX/SURF4 family)
MDQRLQPAWWALRFGFGLTALLAGFDKFFGLLVDWTQYLSPFMRSLSPLSAGLLMQVIGAIEMIVGIVILSGVGTRLGAYAVSVWLVLIAIALVTNGKYFDIAVRDVVMALGAFTLARLSEVREVAPASRRVPDYA